MLRDATRDSYDGRRYRFFKKICKRRPDKHEVMHSFFFVASSLPLLTLLLQKKELLPNDKLRLKRWHPDFPSGRRQTLKLGTDKVSILKENC